MNYDAIKREAPAAAELYLMDIGADIAEFELARKDVALLEQAGEECWKRLEAIR